MTGITMKYEMNLNTIALVLGFAGMFAGLVYAWATMQQQQSSFLEFIVTQKADNTRFYERFDQINDVMADADTERKQTLYRLAQLEESDDQFVTRTDRITENNATALAELRTKLNAIETQVALANQALQRIEQWRDQQGMLNSQRPGRQ
jgi:hypothetical protein